MVRQHFGNAALQAVLETPPTGIFDRQSWSLWHNFFGMRLTEKPDGFFVVYPWFKNRAVKRTQVTAEMIDHLPDYNNGPVIAEGEVRSAVAAG